MNIIFDGNYLFHKTLGVFKSSTEKDLKQELNLTELLSESEKRAQFFRKLIIDFCNTVRIFDKVDKVIFVFDSHSWRKEKYPFYKKKESTEMEILLKQEEQEGWTHFYELMEKMITFLTERGFIVTKALNFEGDDLCYFYANHYSFNNERNVIISGDKDLLQFLNKNISVYRNNSLCPAFYCVEEQYMLQVAEQIRNKYKKLLIEVVDPKRHTFIKMLMGDGGDNVPSLFKGLGEKTSEKVYEIIKEKKLLKSDYKQLNYLLEICDVIKEVCKKSPDIQDITLNLLRNINLMWLDESVYTDEHILFITEELHNKADNFTYKGDYNLGDLLTYKKEEHE